MNTPASPKISPLAVISMITAIAGCVLFFAFGAALGVLAVILAAIARSRIYANPTRLGGAGFASAGITVGLLSIVFSALFVAGCGNSSSPPAGSATAPGGGVIPGGPSGNVSSLARAREISNRVYCAANLTGILKAANVYANDNNDDFPIALRPEGKVIQFAGGRPVSSSSDETVKSMYGSSTAINGNMTANLWVLVLKGYTAPKQFICKSDPNTRAIAQITQNLTFYNNMTGVENFSYSMAIPWNAAGEKQGFWKSIVDASLPLMADMAPKITNTQRANSLIHGGEGQTVGWSDAHSGFERRPDIGYNNDNIWTTSGSAGPSADGSVPLYGPGVSTGATTNSNANYVNSGSAQNWDIFMAPARGTDGKVY